MTTAHAVLLSLGSLALVTATIVVMVRINRSELRTIQRRRQEWIDGGSIPEEEPNFFSGSGGGQGS